MRLLSIIIVLFVIFSSFAVASDFGFNNLKVPSLDSVKEIYCKLTGCTMSGDIHMNNHSIYDVWFINATYVNATYININLTQVIGLNETYIPYTGAISDVDLGEHDLNLTGMITSEILVGNNTMWIESELNHYTCINLMESATLGFKICNDGSGDNRLVFSSMDGGTVIEAFTFDRDSGEITLTGDTDLTGNLVVSDNITADYYFGDGSYLTGTGVNASFNQTFTNSLYVPYINALYDINLNKTLYFQESSGIQKLIAANHTGGDGFSIDYWYDFNLVNDDRLVFVKTDGNDAVPDGGFAWVMQNASYYNLTVLAIDGQGYSNFSSNVEVNNLTTRTNNLCNETTCFTLQELNTTGGGGAGNFSDLNVTTTNYIGTNCTGSDGDSYRNLTLSSRPVMITVDNMFLQPVYDYTLDGSTIVFNNPLYDDMKITFWT